MARGFERRYTDELFSDDGPVRISLLKPSDSISLRGRRVKVADITMNRVKFDCGHLATGIFIAVGDTLYCDDCDVERKVVLSRLDV